MKCVLCVAVLAVLVMSGQKPMNHTDIHKWRHTCNVKNYLQRLSGKTHGHRKTPSEIDRQTDRQTNRQTDKQADGQTNRQADRQADRQNRQADRQIDRQTDKQTNRQASRQTDG